MVGIGSGSSIRLSGGVETHAQHGRVLGAALDESWKECVADRAPVRGPGGVLWTGRPKVVCACVVRRLCSWNRNTVDDLFLDQKIGDRVP